MPIVIIRARDICPSSAGQCPEYTNSCNKLGQSAARLVRQTVPQENKGEPRTRADCDEDLKEGSFGVSVANGCADGWKPFNRVAEVLVLDDLVVVKPHAHDEGTQEGGIGRDGVCVGDELAGDLQSRE